eukprot:6483129-Amphidinium_carterae.2
MGKIVEITSKLVNEVRLRTNFFTRAENLDDAPRFLACVYSLGSASLDAAYEALQHGEEQVMNEMLAVEGVEEGPAVAAGPQIIRMEVDHIGDASAAQGGSSASAASAAAQASGGATGSTPAAATREEEKASEKAARRLARRTKLGPYKEAPYPPPQAGAASVAAAVAAAQPEPHLKPARQQRGLASGGSCAP